MLIFDESKMKKAKANQEFFLEDEDFCVAITDSCSGESVTVDKGDEVWVLDLKTSNNEFLFAYFPKFKRATYISPKLIEMEQTK